MNAKLMATGGTDIAYQPAYRHGLVYRQPTSRSSATCWHRNDDETQEVPREEVANTLGVTVDELREWENAADIEAEEASRADEGDW